MGPLAAALKPITYRKLWSSGRGSRSEGREFDPLQMLDGRGVKAKINKPITYYGTLLGKPCAMTMRKGRPMNVKNL